MDSDEVVDFIQGLILLLILVAFVCAALALIVFCWRYILS